MALDSRRSTWFLSLALAVFVIVSGQVRAIDACHADVAPSGGDATFSILDDSFVALPVTGIPEPIRAPARTLLVPSVSPPGRLVVSDLFRPPMSLFG